MLASLHGGDDREGRGAVEKGHQEDGDDRGKPAPVDRALAAAIVQQCLVVAAAALRTVAATQSRAGRQSSRTRLRTRWSCLLWSRRQFQEQRFQAGFTASTFLQRRQRTLRYHGAIVDDHGMRTEPGHMVHQMS